MENFYLCYNGAAVFVKEEGFFLRQKQQSPEWDTSAWRGPVAAEGVEHARMIGQRMVERGELTARNGK